MTRHGFPTAKLYGGISFVTLATPMHPLLPEERNIRMREDVSFYNLEYAKPITIKDNCWQ